MFINYTINKPKIIMGDLNDNVILQEINEIDIQLQKKQLLLKLQEKIKYYTIEQQLLIQQQTKFLTIEQQIIYIYTFTKILEQHEQQQINLMAQQLQKEIEIIEKEEPQSKSISTIELLVSTEVPEDLTDKEYSERFNQYLIYDHRIHQSVSKKRQRDRKRISKGLKPKYPKLLQKKGKQKKRIRFHPKIKGCSAYIQRQELFRKQRKLRGEKKTH